jgi:hypothetical protein
MINCSLNIEFKLYNLSLELFENIDSTYIRKKLLYNVFVA